MPIAPLRLKNVLKQQSDINLLLFNVADGNAIVLPVQSLLRRNTDQIESIDLLQKYHPIAHSEAKDSS